MLLYAPPPCCIVPHKHVVVVAQHVGVGGAVLHNPIRDCRGVEYGHLGWKFFDRDGALDQSNEEHEDSGHNELQQLWRAASDTVREWTGRLRMRCTFDASWGVLTK